ncbi:hypothetical protein LYZ86_19690 [Xanthomonas hortorum pv. cynarae]|uniref:hypothetical protein n=1 Tax=Xanthomonas hortorum TaxID=56454 RepID=UPI000CEDA292|nr:hypothetical protein [Xanthomonas hortorum]MCE4351416.1 hypothetical protein [Xanthomonas hortorum pv. cynarae]PPU36321.1 hypothetical protein XcyCFBP4188_20315 [Xanthomonas hortorum pv. cynarae]CAD0299274.1 hypothetical protein CFBP2044_01620 [Xanthomonas hortorum pv. cynarae]CAD0299280.1 hypothetical protein CFBP2044_01620 [Xanthomonas hortorum pv. cynarae]
MHVEASGVATFRVNATGQKVSVSASDLEWDCQGDGERNMGPELIHTADFDISGHTVTWSIWEYPVGVENHSDTHVPDGITLVADIDYGLVHDPE